MSYRIRLDSFIPNPPFKGSKPMPQSLNTQEMSLRHYWKLDLFYTDPNIRQQVLSGGFLPFWREFDKSKDDDLHL
jgi:hypothetical protein